MEKGAAGAFFCSGLHLPVWFDGLPCKSFFFKKSAGMLLMEMRACRAISPVTDRGRECRGDSDRFVPDIGVFWVSRGAWPAITRLKAQVPVKKYPPAEPGQGKHVQTHSGRPGFQVCIEQYLHSGIKEQ